MWASLGLVGFKDGFLVKWFGDTQIMGHHRNWI